jgi:hypothetical protein
MALGNIGSSRLQTLWAQPLTAFSTFPNTTGTWTNTGAIKQRYDQFDPQGINPVNSPTYFTGTSSPLIGTRGRQNANWTLAMPLIPSGTAGTAPDSDPILQAIFGGAPTIVASTSVTYNLLDTVSPLGLFWYNKNANETTPTNYYILGACPTTVTFILNQNFLSFRAQGFGYGRGDSTSFASYTSGDAGLKGGLTAYPVEPGSVTQNGNIISGYGNGAVATFDSNSTLELRGQVEIEIATGLEGLGDTFANSYQVAAGRGLRTVRMQRIQCVDSDGTTISNLKAKAFSKSAINIALQVNGAAGNIATFNLKNVQLGGSEISVNGSFLDIIWNDNQAHASSAGVTDDATLVLT